MEEYSEARERNLVKELGNLAPYLRKKGSSLGCNYSLVKLRRGAVKGLRRLFTKNTALC